MKMKKENKKIIITVVSIVLAIAILIGVLIGVISCQNHTHTHSEDTTFVDETVPSITTVTG